MKNNQNIEKENKNTEKTRKTMKNHIKKLMNKYICGGSFS